MVSKYDPAPIQPNKPHKPSKQKVLQRGTFYNVWGFKNNEWVKPTIRAEDCHGVAIFHNIWVAVAWWPVKVVNFFHLFFTARSVLAVAAVPDNVVNFTTLLDGRCGSSSVN